MDKDPTPRPLYKSLYGQVLAATIVGVGARPLLAAAPAWR